MDINTTRAGHKSLAVLYRHPTSSLQALSGIYALFLTPSGRDGLLRACFMWMWGCTDRRHRERVDCLQEALLMRALSGCSPHHWKPCMWLFQGRPLWVQRNSSPPQGGARPWCSRRQKRLHLLCALYHLPHNVTILYIKVRGHHWNHRVRHL